MLGEAFYKAFNKDYELKCTDINVNENWLSSLDFLDCDGWDQPKAFNLKNNQMLNYFWDRITSSNI